MAENNRHYTCTHSARLPAVGVTGCPDLLAATCEVDLETTAGEAKGPGLPKP